MKRVRDGEFGTRKEEPKNPKSKNLSSEISLAGKGYSKVGLETLKLSRSFFFSLFFSFFLSFFLQIRKNSFTKREMVDDAMDTDKGGETALGAAGAGTASNTTTKRKIEVKKWNAVAVWSWSTSFDSCAICRNTLHEPSIEFQANSQQEGADGLSIAVRFTITRVYVAVVLLSFALSRRSAFSNAFVFDLRFKNEISFCSE